MKSIKPPSEYLFTHSLFRHLLNLQVYTGNEYQNILENFPDWPYEDVRDGKFLNTYYYLVVMFKAPFEERYPQAHRSFIKISSQSFFFTCIHREKFKCDLIQNRSKFSEQDSEKPTMRRKPKLAVCINSTLIS